MKTITEWLKETDSGKKVRTIRVELWDEVGRMDWALVADKTELKFNRVSTDWFLKLVMNTGDIKTVPMPCGYDYTMHKGKPGAYLKLHMHGKAFQ